MCVMPGRIVFYLFVCHNSYSTIVPQYAVLKPSGDRHHSLPTALKRPVTRFSGKRVCSGHLRCLLENLSHRANKALEMA